jgi:hypothetical protein
VHVAWWSPTRARRESTSLWVAGQPRTVQRHRVRHDGAYSAGPGWDPCTGWGSPKGAALLQALVYDAHLFDVRMASTTPVLQLSAELPVADSWVFRS